MTYNALEKLEVGSEVYIKGSDDIWTIEERLPDAEEWLFGNMGFFVRHRVSRTDENGNKEEKLVWGEDDDEHTVIQGALYAGRRTRR